MTKIFDACVIESSFEKEGKNKNNYRKVGTVFQHQDGKMSLKLDRFFNPLGAINKDKECWLTFFEQKNEGRSNNNQESSEPSLQSDDIPF